MKVIQTRYFGPGVRSGACIIATDGDGNRLRHGLPVATDAQHPLDDSHAQAARKLCQALGWTGTLHQGQMLKAGRVDAHVFVWENARPVNEPPKYYCPDCTDLLTGVTTDAGEPNYCEKCDREVAGVLR